MAKKTVKKTKIEKKRFTETEIINMVENCDKISKEVKDKVLNFANGMSQALWNMQDDPEKYMHLIDFPDNWQEGHNAIVQKFQEAVLKYEETN